MSATAKHSEANYEPGETLSDAQKEAIVKDVAAHKKDAKARADAVKAAKTSKELGIKPKAAGASAAKKPAAAAGASKAAAPSKAGAPSKTVAATAKKPAAAGAAASGKKPAAGAGAKSGGAKAAGGAKPKAAGKGKAAPVSAEEAAAKEAEAAAAALEALRLQEEEKAAVEAAREAERERLWEEREAQRREIEAAIREEEERVLRREKEKRARLAAEKKKQTALLEAAFDGEMDDVRKAVEGWVEECFGATLIGAKIDCEDGNGNTPLSEAACAGHADVCALLIKHGAAVNKVNSNKRTPLWRAAFQDRTEAVQLLLDHGGDPTIASDSHEKPSMVAPSAAMKALLDEWPAEKTEQLISQREAALAEQWVPPPPDPADAPLGEPGYSLQLGIQRLPDALDTIGRDSDRYSLIVDLSGKVRSAPLSLNTHCPRARLRPWTTDHPCSHHIDCLRCSRSSSTVTPTWRWRTDPTTSTPTGFER